MRATIVLDDKLMAKAQAYTAGSRSIMMREEGSRVDTPCAVFQCAAK
jgi:hypothetical protein